MSAIVTRLGRDSSYRIAWPLIAGAIGASLLGVVLIRSADLHNPQAGPEYLKQLLYIAVGVPVMLLCARIDYRMWQRFAPAIYALNLVLLLAIVVIGHRALGAQRWISLGPLGTFQPSEFAKLFLAISGAAVLARGDYARLRDMWKPLLAFAIPALLVLKQPDFGTSLVLLAILTTQLFFGLPRLGGFALYCAGLFVAGAVTAGTNLVLKPFQKARLLVFLNPKADPQGAGYNLNQAKIAVGNGELFGRGLFHGTQTQLSFVPEHSRDFIFTVLAEELGLVGVLGLFALYGAIIYGGIRAMYGAQDRFGLLLAAGITAMLLFHMLVNIGMTVGIMPITGIPLPFLS
ncbi:MAG TPA: rod shape-determining protein RodA, partial [Candidatus Dormibacteraeota bacterium]|nr:rod shape-determining protein RodA [Candidatus Dormibacteraeota bacterium]